MNRLCAACGKPVYFAERKTSLGREWHPTCLKCKQCGKVLAPGQHAEHKGLPYCHHPCYRALFGPAILGYGSNVSSPANFAKRDRPANQIYGNGADTVQTREIYSLQNHQAHRQNARRSKEKTPPPVKVISQQLQEILLKVKAFNNYNEGKVHQQMVAEEKGDGSIEIRGPLRIYWGLHHPIQLMQCDDIPPAPVSQWRHSLCAGPNSPEVSESRKPHASLSFKQPKSPTHRSRDLDDIFTSPSSSDDVVRRKKPGVRKFKTVAYRGDQPTRWKRASINGHIFNYDTSVFTPVLGSSTSVNIDGNMNSADVIETLLNKFKVQNSPGEYVLSIVSDHGERILTNLDKPLIERLTLGPEEVVGKIFIKEREPEAAGDSHCPAPIVEAAEEENLPEEVELLLVLPEAALREILTKFQKDEEREVGLIKARYNVARNRIQERLSEISNLTSSYA